MFKIEITANTADELMGKLAELAGPAIAGHEQKTQQEVEVVKPQEEPEKPKRERKQKSKVEEKPAGPSEDALREYCIKIASYLLGDPDEAPALADLLAKFGAQAIDEVKADNLLKFSQELFEVADAVFDGMPQVPEA